MFAGCCLVFVIRCLLNVVCLVFGVRCLCVVRR